MKRIKPAELSRILGISSTNVYGYRQGTSKAPMSFVALFLESFPDVSAEWLLRGNGEMLLPQKKSHYLEMAERLHGTSLASEDDDIISQMNILKNEQKLMQSQLDRIIEKLNA
jgi:hypothetical protein